MSAFSGDVFPINGKNIFKCRSQTDTATNYSRWILLETIETWRAAQNLCRKNYTDLASIHTSHEQQQIYTFVAHLTYVWIGLFSDRWEWSDQTNSSFRYWADSETGQTENCTTVVPKDSGRWYDEDCNLKHSFVCYGGKFLHCGLAMSCKKAYEKKSVKKYLVKLKVSFVGNPDLSYRGVLLDNILQQMRKMLEKQRISGGTDLTWRDSNVLQPEKKMENIQDESLILTS
ncbi:hypothetical protein MHYP_G00235310 [Metynnis hypsauchen]